MKIKHLLLIVLTFGGCVVQSQEKIKADLKIINFLGRSPYQSESNTTADNLIKMLYYKPQKNGVKKMGWVDVKEKVIIAPIYDMATEFYGGYANVIRDSAYGYVDKNGTETLLDEYDEVFFYYGDSGVAKKDGKYGLIDRKGVAITEFKYKNINLFGSHHFMALTAEKKFVYIDQTGKVVYGNELGYKIRSYYVEKDSLMIFEQETGKKKQFGLVSMDDKVVAEAVYEEIRFTGDAEFMLVKKEGKYGFIDNKGKVVIPIIYDGADSNIGDGIVAVKQGLVWGYINKDNKIVIPFDYDEAYPFMDGLAYVKKAGLYGCISSKNKVKIGFNLPQPEFPFFSDGMSVYKKDNKYGYLDKTGKVAVAAVYDYAYPFINGIGYVEQNGKTGYIDRKGKVAIAVKYDQMWLESEGLIRFAE